jgi:hypothetical protein
MLNPLLEFGTAKSAKPSPLKSPTPIPCEDCPPLFVVDTAKFNAVLILATGALPTLVLPLLVSSNETLPVTGFAPPPIVAPSV